ncbi:hypothetical protein [Streptomyces sp. NPDC058157]|uniref:hypothetical protein n=1 Tax=Streptomyces sp. NPDC058157 TaxID=3346360 RepID=UPI0036EA69B9
MPLAWLARLPGDAVRLASKVIDYGHGGQGCFASRKRLALELGLHPVTISGYMALLSLLEDGRAMTTEVTGRATPTRRLRPLRRDENGRPAEPFIRFSNDARDALRGNRLKVYVYARFCADTKTEFRRSQAAKLCGITGKDTLRLILRELEADGWITRTEEGGGLHGARYDVHDKPVTHPDPATPTTPETATDPHPNPATQNTSLGTPLSEQAREVSRGSAGTASPVVARGPVEIPADETFPRAVDSVETAAPEAPKKSPTTISATAYRVLRLLQLDFTPGQYALAAKAIEHAVADVRGDVERITHRVHGHLADERQAVRDPYGWLITRGLRNSPCPAPQCEEGRTWPTGADCPTCRERYADRRGTSLIFRDRATAIYEVSWTCSGCECPGTGAPPADGTCDDCHQAASAIKAALTEYHLPTEFENGLRLPDRWRCAEDGCQQITEGARPEHGCCWRCAPKHKRRQRTHRRWQTGETS